GLPDPVLAALGPGPLPAAPAARLALLEACLKAQRANMIERFEPYRELVAVAEPLARLERIDYVSDGFLVDVAVWYHLAWLGESVRIADARVAALMQRKNHFTAADRRTLLTLVGETLNGIVPRYRALAERGQCELAVSPYSHPILPLLYDFKVARESAPASPLPKHAAYPGGAARAAWQMEEALRVFERHFGRRPRGCWPAEGAVSAEVLELIDRSGFDWVATSANVLRASLALAGELDANGGSAAHFDRAYRIPGQKLRCFFRDDNLSDLIGFSYASWHGDDAARNLAHELGQLADRYAGEPGRCVLIALDGENAWEHYPFNGFYFLRAMYAALAEHPQLELTTLSELTARGLEPLPLGRVVAGSWVHGTLATWIGEPSKNAGWDLLCEAKLAYDRALAAHAPAAPLRERLERQLALCESSDWFWWFGDYNPADAVASFDRLYRRQLTTLYRMLELEPPESLSHPVSVAGHGAPERGGVMRRAYAE
ncbi:MAG: glycoside hydrolase family 57 protein, partial [Steroidobacteraceae bacterium]